MLPYPFAGPFDYRVPAEVSVQPGDVVLVPLNRREEIGVVWDPRVNSPGQAPCRTVAGVAQGITAWGTMACRSAS